MLAGALVLPPQAAISNSVSDKSTIVLFMRLPFEVQLVDGMQPFEVHHHGSLRQSRHRREPRARTDLMRDRTGHEPARAQAAQMFRQCRRATQVSPRWSAPISSRVLPFSGTRSINRMDDESGEREEHDLVPLERQPRVAPLQVPPRPFGSMAL